MNFYSKLLISILNNRKMPDQNRFQFLISNTTYELYVVPLEI
jgi:hypothetical protein